MMDPKKGFMSFALKENSKLLVEHCLLHRENLAAKEGQPDLKSVFDEVVQMVNFIKKEFIKRPIVWRNL